MTRVMSASSCACVQELYEAGVRRVAVMGVPPLGCAPRVMWERIPTRDSGCVEEANELIEAYNGRLAARVDGSVEEGELTNSCGRRWPAEMEALISTLAR